MTTITTSQAIANLEKEIAHQRDLIEYAIESITKHEQNEWHMVGGKTMYGRQTASARTRLRNRQRDLGRMERHMAYLKNRLAQGL